MPKFAKGDKVTYNRGDVAVRTGLSRTVKVVVDKISVSDGISTYKEPLYHISWPPRGKACVRESQLS